MIEYVLHLVSRAVRFDKTIALRPERTYDITLLFDQSCINHPVPIVLIFFRVLLLLVLQFLHFRQPVLRVIGIVRTFMA